MNKYLKPFRIVAQTAPNPNAEVTDISLFNDAGLPVTINNFSAVVTGTAIGTAAKTTTSAEPVAGSIVPIRFTNGNNVGSPTVAFAGGTARAINLGGAAPASGECTLAAGGVGIFWFDGTILHQMGVYS